MHQQYEAISKQNDHFQTQIELRAAFDEGKNKQKNAKF